MQKGGATKKLNENAKAEISRQSREERSKDVETKKRRKGKKFVLVNDDGGSRNKTSLDDRMRAEKPG